MDANTSHRKDQHLDINLIEDIASGVSNGLEAYSFLHQALPQINLSDVDLSLTVFGKRLRAPLLISSMTGGSPKAARYNQLLAAAAQEFGLAMGVGSQRAALENPELVGTYDVRGYAPDALLFANLGAIQLNKGYGIRECQRAVEMIRADALILHLNPLQEALQPEGDTNFAGMLSRIELICSKLAVPVIVKEVGWGINTQLARQLLEAGVAAIDVAGAGGTSWSQVEMHRQTDPNRAKLAASFRGWGIPTARCLREIKSQLPDALVFASGGLKNGLDIAKTLALGAVLGGMAGPLIRAADAGYTRLRDLIDLTITEIRICLFACGKPDLQSFNRSVLLPPEE
ncbi:MAG TPA: type 2 isopentenyl-diphosphate Delta-isomerase [Anaerolineaceae bacterium]|jgi:isopentenyl-diphosphate delta-isomerase|nr:type 2 isopentenyl-diphosphate Delta-isomerase [Anaerolineaceae bacterium]NMD26744.1 type 2 isopentenyl-diphosphate Delta-isomerase [Chloroflexota bacterium]HOA21752.1 type 2 isopentenyl-diphosphate Delta-isomerase [Anaerolineaceae bacterium]HOG76835.1 type 2 isopentenyl-diphosphate Delta-isomerase [Anaerolineaceae bacterium]